MTQTPSRSYGLVLPAAIKPLLGALLGVAAGFVLLLLAMRMRVAAGPMQRVCDTPVPSAARSRPARETSQKETLPFASRRHAPACGRADLSIRADARALARSQRQAIGSIADVKPSHA